MLNRSASLAMSTSILKALPGKHDIKRHSPSILYILSLSLETATEISLSNGYVLYFQTIDNKVSKGAMIRPRGYKTFFMLNSAEHEISTAHKTKIPTNEEIYCIKSLRCCIYHAHKC